MTDSLTADDPRYRELFDVAKDTTTGGRRLFGDLTPRMNSLREQGAVHEGLGSALLGASEHDSFHPPRETYTLFTFDACDRAFRDNETFSSEIYRDLPMAHAFGDTILWKVGVEHRRLRAVAQAMFIRPKAMGWWRQNWIDEIVGKLLDNIDGSETSDLNFDLCARLPMQVISQGFGLAGEAALDYRDQLMRAVGALDATPQEKAVAMETVDRTLRELIAARRTEPRDDVVSGLLQRDLELDGGGSRKLTDEEVFGYCRLVMFAGGGTTWRQLGITLLALLTHDGAWAACGKNRDLVPSAVEESIRWLPTDPFMPRLVTRDVEVAGRLIPAGARVDICIGAANRDPARWDDPDAYDVFRPMQYNLGTAIGPHRCLGHDVTRQEMVWAINGLLDRFPNLRLDPDAPSPRIIGGTHQRGVSALPVLLR